MNYKDHSNKFPDVYKYMKLSDYTGKQFQPVMVKHALNVFVTHAKTAFSAFDITLFLRNVSICRVFHANVKTLFLTEINNYTLSITQQILNNKTVNFYMNKQTTTSQIFILNYQDTTDSSVNTLTSVKNTSLTALPSMSSTSSIRVSQSTSKTRRSLKSVNNNITIYSYDAQKRVCIPSSVVESLYPQNPLKAQVFLNIGGVSKTIYRTISPRGYVRFKGPQNYSKYYFHGNTLVFCN